jgi:ribonuclease P protein component
VVVHAAVAPSGTDGTRVTDAARVGLIVSRAVGSAVVRNRVKRRLRAAMAPRVANLPPGALVVLRANPAAGAASASDLTSDLESALERAMQQAVRREVRS